MTRWLPTLALLAACAPPAYLVEYQQAHEREWIPISALPDGLQGMTTAQLQSAMGQPMQTRVTTSSSMRMLHLDYCDAVRSWNAGQGPQQWVFDGQWRPVAFGAFSCGTGSGGEGGFTLGRPVRVVVVNGVVAQVYY